MRGKEWTSEEMDVLVSEFRRADATELMARLPGRSWHAICGKASRLLIRRKPTAEEWKRMMVERPGCSSRYYAHMMGVCQRTAQLYMVRG